jgi:hypothetical protein
MTSVIPNKNDMDDATSGKKDCSPHSTPHQPHSFQAAANAHQGMRDEQYLLNRVYEKMNVEQDEVLGAAPAPQQLEDGAQLTVDELVEINLGTDDDPRPTFVSATVTLEERESYRTFLM